MFKDSIIKVNVIKENTPKQTSGNIHLYRTRNQKSYKLLRTLTSKKLIKLPTPYKNTYNEKIKVINMIIVVYTV
jgi:hypothetical protein